MCRSDEDHNVDDFVLKGQCNRCWDVCLDLDSIRSVWYSSRMIEIVWLTVYSRTCFNKVQYQCKIDIVYCKNSMFALAELWLAAVIEARPLATNVGPI